MTIKIAVDDAQVTVALNRVAAALTDRGAIFEAVESWLGRAL